MKKRSMRGLAAALVLAMALPVTAFGAETVQVLWDVFGLRAPEDAAL